MRSAIDEAYFKYSVYSAMESGMQVKCPKCLGIGMIADIIEWILQIRQSGTSLR